MTTHSDALVDELALVHAIAWECHDISPVATCEPEVNDHDRAAMRAVLGHLLAQGWTPPTDGASLGPSAIVVNVSGDPGVVNAADIAAWLRWLRLAQRRTRQGSAE